MQPPRAGGNLCADEVRDSVFKHRLSRSWIRTFAVVAAIGILVVLITPAADELPTTGPHALVKVFLPSANPIYLLPLGVPPKPVVSFALLTASANVDLLSLTCT